MASASKRNKGRAGSGSDDSHWMDRRDHRDWSHFGRSPSRRERSRERALKDWFGEDGGRFEIMAHQRPAEHVSGALDEVLSKFGMKTQVLIRRIQDAWPDLVGADIAAQTSPILVRGNRLLVEVSNSSWMYELNTMHRREIGKRVNEFTGGAVKDVSFVPPGRRYGGG